jgi:iron complex transport system substrate-binding protein
MLYKLNFYLITLLCAISFSCADSHQKKEETLAENKNSNSVRYAKRFAIVNHADYTLVYLFGNRTNFDTTARFLIYTDDAVATNTRLNTIGIKTPCKKIAAMSSIYASMFCELGVINQLAAIDNIDYVNNTEIIKKNKDGLLKELSKGPEINLEQTIALQPDILFTFGMGDPQKDLNEKLLRTKIPVAVSLDHLEESPLARAEWIKFYAAFAGKQERGDSLFNVVEKNYETLKAIAKTATSQATVFSEIKYAEVWYMPGGKSFMAQLIADAQGHYLWHDDKNTGSLPLSFEQVYAKAKDADVWINLSGVKTKKELLGFESRYSAFKAFKTGQMYNNNKFTNALGYSTYWETGMIHPDRILSDIIQLLHPELKSQIKNDLYYYQQIN